jgi:hypothetical protein
MFAPHETDKEALELLSQIEVLRKLFPDKSGQKAIRDDANTVIYLSRFPSEHSNVEKKKKGVILQGPSSAQVEVAAEVTPTKSTSVSAQTREKKRQYAMSLVTLAAEPSKRAQLVVDGAIDMLVELSTIDGMLSHFMRN